MQVVEPNAAFVGASALLNLAHQGWNAGVQVDKQVGSLDKLLHEAKELLVGVVVARAHQAHVVQVGRKNIGVFVDGAVLNHVFALTPYAVNLAEPAVQEVNLQVEGPSRHVVIKLVEVGILVHLFKVGLPAIVLGE